jgi:hypothetical protein
MTIQARGDPSGPQVDVLWGTPLRPLQPPDSGPVEGQPEDARKSLDLVLSHAPRAVLAARAKTKKNKGGRTMSMGPRTTAFSIYAVMPPRLTTTMQFAQGGNATSALNLFVNWRLNDLYDPDPGLGGPELVGFSELTAFYKNYIVRRGRVRLVVYNTSPSTVTYNFHGPSSRALAGTETFPILAGQPGFRFVPSCSYAASPFTDETTGWSDWIDLPKMLGWSQQQATIDENWWGDSGHSPTTPVYYPYVGIAPSSVQSWTYLMFFQFECEFFNRLELTG